MADTKVPLGQQYYEEVEALKGNGSSNADAIRQVAEKHGKNENAVRGGLHQYRAKLDGSGSNGTRSPRRRQPSTPSVDDLVANARRSLEDALELVDKEVEQAKSALDAAQARYDEAVAAVKERKASIQAQLDGMK